VKALHADHAGVHARRPTSERTLPTFLVIGAARAGTTSIYRHLRQHPEVFLPARKELHFFDRDESYNSGIDHYERFFRRADAKAIGEVTPSYLHRAPAAMRIKRHLEDVKLIVSLRDPVDRVYSRYWNARGRYAENEGLSFEEKLARKPEFIREGYYYDHLRRYLELFDREQVLCLLFDDLKSDGRAFMQSIYRFLEVSDDFLPKGVDAPINASATKKRNAKSKLLYYLRGISSRLSLDSVAGKLEEVNRAAIPPIDPETRRRLLHEHYLVQIDKLENLIDQDLTVWKKGA
jgi:hypothetical protein